MTETAHRMPTTALWRDVHKGIRFGLLTLIGVSGSSDPDDADEREILHGVVHELVDLLDSHAEAEDRVTGPVIDEALPALGAEIRVAHAALEPRAAALRDAADRLSSAPDRYAAMRELHLDIAAFAGEYLLHQDHEERVVLPALEDAIGVDRVRALEVEFVAAVDPDDRLLGLEFMIPAMNVAERAEVIGAIRAHAPAPFADEVWEIATDVLEPEDLAALEARIAAGRP